MRVPPKLSRRPTETACLSCGQTFLQPVRAQGGGRHTKYCSARCRSLDWVRGNAGKRKAAVLKYEQVPENKDKRRRQARVRMLWEYDLTLEDFNNMLLRQRGRCLGCLSPIDEFTARVDHDHATGRVRGLLCNHCNWTLGHADDKKATLRRLMSYLDYDRTQANIYLIGALKNPEIQVIAKQLRAAGFGVWDDWHAAGPEADEWWQRYEQARGRTFQEALAGKHAQDVFHFDLSLLDLADAAVLVMPAGRSGHLEFGYFAGGNKPAFILLDKEPERYDVMPNFAHLVCHSFAELLQRLREENWRLPK